MKKLLTLLYITLCFSCAIEKSQTRELEDFLPKDSGVILKLNNPDLFFNNLKNNEFLKINPENPAFTELREQTAILNFFPHKEEALLALTSKGENSVEFTFIGSEDLIPVDRDAIQNKQIETSQSKKGKIVKFILEGKTAFSTKIGSISILSSSKSRIEDILSGEVLDEQDLQTAYKAASKKKNSIFINHKKIPALIADLLPSNFPHLSNWTVVDTEISQTDIRLNGITVATDNRPHLINVFKNVGPASNEIAEITPLSTTAFTSITFKDFQELSKNLEVFRGDTTKMNDSKEFSLLSIATEAGIIQLQEGDVFVLRTHNPDSAKDLLNLPTENAVEYRGNTIFGYSEENSFQEILQPLLDPKEIRFISFLEPYILFSVNSEAIKQVIAAVQNDLVLANTEAYKNSAENLSSEASLLMVRNDQAVKGETAATELDFSGFPIAALQFIYEDNFAHVHSVLSKSSELKKGQATTQAASTDLNAPLASLPVFFKNHRSKGMDVAVQDIENTLYLISPEGMIYWKKQLNSRILGEVETVDILRNGRYQLAFATQNKLHVIDRDGNPVKPFPLNFRDDITQPLAVFDYDGKKNYRFVVVQDKEVFMYDRKGNRVKGFTFSKAASIITQPPKHIRMGRKDYIVIPEASGKLNVLNRKGQVRVPVKENLDFTENKWFEYNGNFISTNKSGQLIKISEKGNISREDLNLANNHRITATERTLVTLSDNELKIKGNSATLDFGLYTQPQIFYLNNKIYVSVTDLQAEKIFLFDSNAELIKGFPVYGTSKIDLNNADADSALELVVQGGEGEVLVYEIQ